MNFYIDRDSAAPLYRQLELQLRNFVAVNPAGTRLPSERELGMDLGISRLTVRKVFAQLAREKLIVRRGYLGSFIAEAGGVPAPAETGDSILNYFLDSFPAKMKLRLLFFEYHPNQQGFWRRTIEEFNRQNHGIEAEFLLLERGIHGAELEAFIHRESIDILQDNMSTHPYRLCQPLYGDLQHLLADERRYQVSFLKGAPPEASSYLFPVYFNFYAGFYNRDMLRRAGLPEDLTAALGGPDLFAQFRELRRRLDCEYIVHTPGELLMAMGIRQPDFFAGVADFLKNLSASAQERLIRPTIFSSPAERLRYFLNRRQVLYISWANLALHLFPNPGFPVGMSPILPQPGGLLYSGGSFLTVTANTKETGAANIFLRYLLTPEVQRRIVRELCAVPYSREAVGELQLLSEALPPERWEDGILARMRAFELQPEHDLIYNSVDIFRDVLDGTISDADAMTQMRLRWQGMQQHRNAVAAG
ncbi:GntR family transcriptional regulator [Victivallis sp. Marseille-Q1083]|uniref:GntR family transcriptional regulator n=1 Tax=Victivallis sp. Marseille-Q1083 TaxID=2717288 RepID=UPI001589C7E3|nr:GntR family transcriptional regulator [Victivallis sp. Marseille-Q1083]